MNLSVRLFYTFLQLYAYKEKSETNICQPGETKRLSILLPTFKHFFVLEMVIIYSFSLKRKHNCLFFHSLLTAFIHLITPVSHSFLEGSLPPPSFFFFK